MELTFIKLSILPFLTAFRTIFCLYLKYNLWLLNLYHFFAQYSRAYVIIEQITDRVHTKKRIRHKQQIKIIKQYRHLLVTLSPVAYTMPI